MEVYSASNKLGCKRENVSNKSQLYILDTDAILRPNYFKLVIDQENKVARSKKLEDIKDLVELYKVSLSF